MIRPLTERFALDAVDPDGLAIWVAQWEPRTDVGEHVAEALRDLRGR